MKLNKKMMKAAELESLSPNMTYGEIADEVGIDKSNLWRWRQTEEYQEYLHKCCEKRFRGFEKTAIELLQQNALNGNQKAIEYLLNYIGYQPSQKVEMDLDGSVNINIDYGDN